MTAGRFGRWATILPGSGPTRTGSCAPSIRKRDFSAWRRGRSEKTNPNAMATLSRNTIFTNVALTPDGGVWWEGMTESRRPSAWTGGASAGRRRSGSKTGRKAAHPNGAVYGSGVAVPDDRSEVGDRRTACRSAQSFSAGGGRRRCRWSTRRSIGAAACTSARRWARRRRRRQAGAVGKVRRDPMAMLPFCGYHMGDYFRHWIKMQRGLERDAARLSRELVPEG